MTEVTALEPLPATRADVVAAALRRMILSGELPAGSRLRQTEVSERFGVSTTPVREAFMTLCSDGLVRQDAHRGFTVLLPSLDDLRENFEIRSALEPLATRYATERITPAQIRDLQRLVDRANTLADQSERKRLNRVFHAKLYDVAGRPRLAELIENLRNSADVYLNLLLQHPASEHSAQIAREHQEILDAIRDRNSELAAEGVRQHLLHHLSWISEVLADLSREPGSGLS